MRLKLDLHDIYNNSSAIEASLDAILREAVRRRAREVEIIPGKGSGALKKTVVRFLQRPDIRALYHRIEKDDENWGRLYVHFRHAAAQEPPSRAEAVTVEAPCACCGCAILVRGIDPLDRVHEIRVECPSCGTPNRVTARRGRQDAWRAVGVFDYSATGEGE